MAVWFSVTKKYVVESRTEEPLKSVAKNDALSTNSFKRSVTHHRLNFRSKPSVYGHRLQGQVYNSDGRYSGVWIGAP